MSLQGIKAYRFHNSHHQTCTTAY